MKKKLIAEISYEDLFTGKRTGLLTQEDELIKLRIQNKDYRRLPLTKRQWRNKLEKIGLPELITKELFDDIDSWKKDE